MLVVAAVVQVGSMLVAVAAEESVVAVLAERAHHPVECRMELQELPILVAEEEVLEMVELLDQADLVEL
jgi:hypothetical protein